MDVPVVLHDTCLLFRNTEDCEDPTGPVRRHARRFPSCVTTPSANHPDDTATVEVSQSQQLDRWIHARIEAEASSDQPGNPEDRRDGTRADCTETGENECALSESAGFPSGFTEG